MEAKFFAPRFARANAFADMSETVLSVFGGIGLLDSAFEDCGFQLSHGPELLRGVDVRGWHPGRSHDGVIGGSPCQDFSDARRTAPTGAGVEMLREFLRIVTESRAKWFLLENVRRVPAVALPGFHVQRLMLCNSEFGGVQRRLRCIQFGSLDASQIAPVRSDAAVEECQLAPTLTGGSAVTELEAWHLQGHAPRPLALGKCRALQAIANGVPYPLALALARAVARRVTEVEAVALCACGCGRWLPPGRSLFAQECRQRVSREARRPRAVVEFLPCTPAGAALP